ncbi:MAG: hypothetical protein Q9166_005385 [cf. Caloplaca sp. 2 TL-2023]
MDYGVDAIDDVDPKRAQVFSMRSSTGNEETPVSAEVVPCVFIALGWLVERESGKSPILEQASEKKTTNYVVLLNLTTEPVSVWLMYDYHMIDFLEEVIRWTNRLGEGEYYNRLTRSGLEPSFTSEVPGAFAESGRTSGCIAQYKDFLKCYTNEDVMRHKGNKASSTQSAADDSYLHSDKGFPSKPSHTSDSPRGETTTRNLADDEPNMKEGTPPSSIGSNDHVLDHDQTGKGSGKGYFGLAQPFDLALLAPDFNDWDPVEGLDQKLVKLCLDSTLMRLGSSLRVKSITDEEIKKLSLGKRVNIQALNRW